MPNRASNALTAGQQATLDLLRVLAGVLAGAWLPFVISHSSIGHDQVLSLAVDMAFLVLAGASTAFAFRGRLTWRRWLRLARDLAIALPLWTMFNVESTPHWWLWACKLLALLYLVRLASLLSRIDALPPSAARLLLLAVVMPLCVWWAATGWLVLGGDSGTTARACAWCAPSTGPSPRWPPSGTATSWHIPSRRCSTPVASWCPGWRSSATS